MLGGRRPVSPVSSAASPRLPRRSIQTYGLSSSRAIGAARSTKLLGVAIAGSAQRRVGCVREQARAGTRFRPPRAARRPGRRAGGGRRSSTQPSPSVRRPWRPPSHRRPRSPRAAPRRRARLRRRGGRRTPPRGRGPSELATGSAGRARSLAIASASASAVACSAPRPSGHRARPCTEGADAQRWVGVGARHAQCPVDPLHRVCVAMSHQPEPAERCAHRECRFGAGRSIAQASAAWRLSMSASSPAMCSLLSAPESARSVPWRWASAR